MRYQKLKRRGNISNQLDRWTVGIVDICWQDVQMDDGPLVAFIPNGRPVFHWIVPDRDHQVACSKNFVCGLVVNLSDPAAKATEVIHRDGSGSLKCSDHR